jgi:8-oxo-dGTP pyrophosphatase MutT (NUDIX family)
MSAKILVVDDEPDLEGLILQKFRRQIRDGSVSFAGGSSHSRKTEPTARLGAPMRRS